MSTPMPGPRNVTVAGGEVLLEGDIGTILTDPPCVNIPPCGGYALTSMGLNATTVQGRRVMLVSDFVQSATGFPLTKVETHVVYDKTLPGTPPATGAQIPPELGEDDQPTVEVAPPSFPFSKATFASSGTPPSVLFTFVLASAYPLRWMLWHVGPPAMSVEATAGVPGSLIVVPAGGSLDGTWSSTSMTVGVTVMGPYLAALAPGKHEFILTGINRRGFSDFAQGEVNVT